MSKIYNEYKENIKYFITKKTYIITIIMLTILCYGFYITNFSVGVDDFSQDRYVTGTYLLSQGRWGNVLLARLLNFTTFVPFWTEFIATIFLVFTAILLSAFIRKEIGHIVDKTVYYVLFSGILISYPVIHHIFLYNLTNLIIGLNTLGMIVMAIIIYENTFNIKNKKIYFVIAIILPLFISMYEASCQVFLVFIFIAFFINIIKSNSVDKKKFQYILNSILVLAAGILINELININIKNILSITGNLTKDFSTRKILWLNYDISTSLNAMNINIFQGFKNDIKNLDYIGLFFIISVITLIISAIQSVKEKNIIYIITSTCIFLANFAINVMQISIIYRIDISWSITIAFMVLYILISIKKYDTIKDIFIVFISIIILYNSKTLNLLFYNEHVRYEREKNIAYDIANTIIRTCDDLTKPLVYIPYNIGDVQGNSINTDNGWSVISWGMFSFGSRGAEITKFINSLGYNFEIATNEEWEEGKTEFEKIENNYEKDFIIELDKYIIVKVIYEPR